MTPGEFWYLALIVAGFVGFGVALALSARDTTDINERH